MAKCIYWTEESYDEFMMMSGNLLSNRQKRIIDMRYHEEYSIQQLAAVFDVSEPTIHKDIKRIKEVYELLYKRSDKMLPLFKNSKEMKQYIEKL